MKVFGLWTLYFFISRTITPSGLRLMFNLGWPMLTSVDLEAGATGVTGLNFDCTLFCLFSCLLAVFIFDLTVLRRIDSFFHFSCVLKYWPIKSVKSGIERSAQYKFKVENDGFGAHLNCKYFGWHVSDLIFICWCFFTRFLDSTVYTPVLTLFR